METQKHPTIQTLALVAGIASLIGIFFPVVLPMFGVIFPEFKMLSMPVGIFAKINAVFPIITAVLIFVGQAQPKYTTRAIFYFIAGFTPILLGFAAVGEYSRELSSGGFGSITGLFSIGLFGYILGLGILAMMSASVAGSINRQSPLVGYAALAGGGLTALAMIFPVGLGRGGGVTVMLIMPFQTMANSFFIGLIFLIFVAGMVAAAVFSLLWGINQKNGVNHSRLVQMLVIGSFAVTIILMMFVGIFEMAGEGMFFSAIIMLFTTLIHSMAALVGSFLAKMLGVVELLTFTNIEPQQSSNSTTDKVW